MNDLIGFLPVLGIHSNHLHGRVSRHANASIPKCPMNSIQPACRKFRLSMNMNSPESVLGISDQLAKTHRKLLGTLNDLVAQNQLIKIIFSQPISKLLTDSADLVNISGRLIQLNKTGLNMQFTYRFKTKDTTRNVPVDQVAEFISKELLGKFKQINVMALSANWQYKLNKKLDSASWTSTKSEPSDEMMPMNETATHDRIKNRVLDPSERFLFELGITNEQGNVRPGKNDKFIQIQRFVEILGHTIQSSSLNNQTSRSISVVDMGCGKGYLTFGVHSYLKSLGYPVKTIGVEIRKDLVDFCNHVADKVGLAPDLQFAHVSAIDFLQQSSSPSQTESMPVDILIALHACDTATDDALFNGIQSNSKIIISAPCCHKQVRQEMAQGVHRGRGVLSDMPEIESDTEVESHNARSPVLRNVMKHGILLERQAELVTDTIRSALLEIKGYQAKVFEFVDSEHTAKNLLITAVRKTDPITTDTKKMRDLVALCGFYGVYNQRLADLLEIKLR